MTFARRFAARWYARDEHAHENGRGCARTENSSCAARARAVDSRTDEPRRRALHGQHSRANARETEQMSGDSPSGGAHFSMCTFDRAECTDGRVLAAGGAAIRGSTGR